MSDTLHTPKTLQEAILYFSDPDVCLAYVASIRWPDGIVRCPTCGRTDAAFQPSRRLWKCKTNHPRRQFSVKVGTIFEDSPLGLDKWLTAVWMIANDKNGVSSYEVARALGVTQKSAWFMLHRIRLAMQSGTFLMSGTVEVDETYIGGKARNMHADKRAEKVTGRGGAGSGKAVVFGILERHSEKGKSKVKATVVPDAKRRTLQPIIRSTVEKGSTVYSDALKSYEQLEPDYLHDAIDHAETYVRGAVHTNGLENFWSLFKRGIHGTYVSVEPFHLFRYIDEEAFRFNERSDDDSGRFEKAAGGIVGKRLTYKKLTGKVGPLASEYDARQEA